MGKTQNETIYDENALKLLKQKIVLAYILSYTVKEFYTMDIDSIAHCIEGEPEIHKTAVDERGQDISDFVAPMISGKDPNRKSRQEGNIRPEECRICQFQLSGYKEGIFDMDLY